MDTQHHDINHTSTRRGSHGVHLCHKCRWPFSNAKPSAKLRRAHKKVCGTIEGYKLFASDDHLAALEGWHASCEDQLIASTSDNPIAATRSIKTLNLEVNEQVKEQLQNYNPFSEAITEDSPVGSVRVIDLHFDASPVEATRESPEPYLNEIDKQASYNLRGESLTPVADIEKESKSVSNENKYLDFVSQDTLVENDNSPLEKCLDMENSVGEFDGDKSNDQSEFQHIFEQNEEGKEDMYASLFKKKEEETSASNLEEQKEAAITVYPLSVPESLAGIVNVSHLVEDFEHCASPESSLSLNLGSAEVFKSVRDDKQPTIAGKSVSGFCSVDSTGGIDSSTTYQYTLKNNLNENEVEKPITFQSCVSGSTEESAKDHGSCSLKAKPDSLRAKAESIGIYDISLCVHNSLPKPDSEIVRPNESHIMSPVLTGNSEETANLVTGDDADQNERNKIEESDDGREQCTRPLEDQLAAIAKRTQGAYSSFLSADFQVTSSLKVHQSQVLKQSAIELSELLETIEKFGGAVGKNTEVGHKAAEPEQKFSDLYLHQSDFDSRGIMEQSTFSSCKGLYKLPPEITASQGEGSGYATDDANYAGGQSEKSQAALQIGEGAAECHSVNSDDFAPPSFMTLVEPGNGVPQEATPSHLTASSTEHNKAGWFPSMSNVVNEWQKIEEIIAKTGREHAPVKSQLGESRSPNLKQPTSTNQNDDISLKSTGTAVTTVESILRSEPNDKELEKERDSPARYPVEIKKEKRKHWLSFVCCSSVDRDL